MVPPQLVESVPTCNLSRANESSRARMRASAGNTGQKNAPVDLGPMPADGFDAAAKKIRDLGTSRWQLPKAMDGLYTSSEGVGRDQPKPDPSVQADDVSS